MPATQNGKYLGDIANTSWGDVQVQVVIDNNRIASVSAVQYPQDRPLSAKINQVAIPMLEQEAVHVQSAEVDTRDRSHGHRRGVHRIAEERAESSGGLRDEADQSADGDADHRRGGGPGSASPPL